jgi:Mn2+/Fe2+ NRAMP family transporter
VIELFVIHIDWAAVVGGLLPSCAGGTHVEALVAIFGTTISPYLFVWQAGEEVEERKAKGSHAWTNDSSDRCGST